MVSSVILERRKSRKGFACSTTHIGSLVEEERPVLQAR